MSQRGRQFAEEWVSENIDPDVYQPEGDNSEAQKAERLLAAAIGRGISQVEIEEEVGDLAGFLSSAMENATDDEVERLASKDN